LGLSDLDAVILSSLQLHFFGMIGNQQAVTAIVMELTANTVLKLAASRLIGGGLLARAPARNMLSFLLGLAAGWATLQRGLPVVRDGLTDGRLAA